MAMLRHHCRTIKAIKIVPVYYNRAMQLLPWLAVGYHWLTAGGFTRFSVSLKGKKKKGMIFSFFTFATLQ